MVDEAPEIEGSDLSALISGELSAALTYDSADLANKRVLAVEYMRGEMSDLPARANGSQLTSRDFADAVAWILPGVVRVFTASDQMVKYDKVRSEDDRWSREATEYTNYTFFRESDGYRILYNATYDSLTLGNGLACSYWEPRRAETKRFADKTELEIAMLLNEGWQPTGSAKPGKPKDVTDPESGQTVTMDTLTVKLDREIEPGRIIDRTCKPENLFLSPEATTIDEARFSAYLHDDKTRSDLMAMADEYGWDIDVIKELPSYANNGIRQVSDARQGQRLTSNDSPVKSGELINLFECYYRVDVDGDGKAEFIQAWYAGDISGGRLLGWDEYEGDVPYTDIPCYPQPHRWDALSVFDRTADIAKAKTVLLRQAADNLYASNLPMQEVDQGSVLNPEILVNPKFGGIIWKKTGSSPITTHAVQFVADKAFSAMQYFDEIIAKRTGVSRTTMALDPEALQNQTATATQAQRDAGYSQIELIARNMAELGWAKFFKKRLKLAIKYAQVRSIPSGEGDQVQGADGQPEASDFMQVTPDQWDPNMAVSINVGLGTGSRDRDMAMLQNVQMGQLGMADRLGAAGLTDKALDFLIPIRQTAVRIAESAGLKNPEEYYPDITEEDVAAMKQQAAQAGQAPDPATVKAQMDQAAKDAQAQRDHEYRMQQISAKREMDVIAAQNKLALDKYQTDQELALRQWQIGQEMAMNERLGLHKQAVTSAVQVGGNPG